MNKKTLNYIRYVLFLVSVPVILYLYNFITGKTLHMNVSGATYPYVINLIIYGSFLLILWHGYVFHKSLFSFLKEKCDVIKVVFYFLNLLLFGVLILVYLSPFLGILHINISYAPYYLIRCHHIVSLYVFIYMFNIVCIIKKNYFNKANSD